MRLSLSPPAALGQSFVHLHVPAVAWISLLFAHAMAQMPYNPTRLLQHDSILYVFRPSSASSPQFELGSIDLSSRIADSSIPFTTLYPSLPFQESNNHTAFTPLLDNGGNITVYTGDCTEGASGGEVWSFTPKASGKSGNGTWKQEKVTFEQSDQHTPAMGSNYLSAGMAFSSSVDGDVMDTAAYIFGGMCPSSADTQNWQSAANYSNLMVSLEPSQDGSKALTYQLDESPSRGPPIAEAGFTLTGLEPTFSNKSDGTETQQQNFVLVGGHTSTAFINMSQVALFSLPQQSWAFLPVTQPSSQRTDLTTRSDVDEVEPRSGHSAVLTPDGQRIIIFGGWIGDINTPADPQVAVLNVGEGYGGQGDWAWTVPTTSGSGLPSGSGIYGHGAVMLPGGVMMVMGGYSMSAPSSRQRRADSSANTQTFLFNTTSNTWISEYSPPSDVTSSGAASTGPLTTTSQKAGLGAGLGIGVAALAGLLVFYFWYVRRLKKQRDVREKQLRDLAMSAHRYNIECLTPGVDGRGGNIDAVDYFDDPADSYYYPNGSGQHSQGWRRSQGQDAERTGLLVEIPSPTRGLRRSLSGRSNHHMPRYDERRVRGSGNIHPIDELEEDDQDNATDRTPLAGKPEMTEQRNNHKVSIFDSAPILDPFVDRGRLDIPSGGRKSISAPTSPLKESSLDERMNDLQLALGALLPRRSSPQSGRMSPTKSVEHSDERTTSNLSEHSARSNLSSHSARGTVSRSASNKSAPLLNNGSQTNPFRSPDASPTLDKANCNSGGWQTPADPRTLSLTSVRSNGQPVVDTDSFTTARTSFMQLQAEGEALLGGNSDRARPGTASSSNGSNAQSSKSEASAIVGTAATSIIDGFTRPRERRKSWLGSVRRALSRSTTTADPRTRSLTTATTPVFDRYTDDPDAPTRAAGSTSRNSNRMSYPASAPPRRAASDASFWRSRRGKQDWLDEELDPNDPSARWRRNSGDNWGAPEDLAHAEQERRRRQWRERANLINLDDDNLPSPGGPTSEVLNHRPSTPADEDDWDVEAAVERRVVQFMFTVPRTRLRVVNADTDRASLLSLPAKEEEEKDNKKSESSGNPSGNPNSPGRVKDLVGRFEREDASKSTPRSTPRPSPSPSIKSIRSAKLRSKESTPSLGKAKGKGKIRDPSADITDR